MTEVKVYLGGEGANELGSRVGALGYQTGETPAVVEALLRRVEPHGWPVIGANQDELGRNIQGSITHARARELTERHSRDVTLKLQELLRRGYLESDGKTRGTAYRPVLGDHIGHNIGHSDGLPPKQLLGNSE